MTSMTARDIYDYFVGRGLAPHQAAALAARKIQESGGRHDAVHAGDRGAASIAPHSFGLSQWNDTRLMGLVDFARRSGIDVPQLNLREAADVSRLGQHIPARTQLDYAWHEMQGPERNAYRSLTQAQNVQDAVGAAMGFYRPRYWTRENPTMGLGYGPTLRNAERLMSEMGGAPGVAAPVAAVAEPAPAPTPLRDESRPLIADRSTVPRGRDESRPPIFGGMVPGFKDGGAVKDAIEAAAERTNTDPTDAQKESGNYAKGKVRLYGLEIAIENPKGSMRSGVDLNGKRWSVKMPAHYGYIRRFTHGQSTGQN